MSYPSFRRFLENKRSRVKGGRSRQRKPGRTKLFLEALEHRLAPATAQDVLPAAIVNSQTALTSTSGNNNPINVSPQVAVDPVNPSKIFEVHATGLFDANANTAGGGIAGFCSSNGGASFSSFSVGTSSLPQFLLPLTVVDAVSVALDRTEEVFVAFSLHSTDNTSGAIEFARFNFTGSTATLDGVQSLYTWSNSDPAYNPSVVVDSNVP